MAGRTLRRKRKTSPTRHPPLLWPLCLPASPAVAVPAVSPGHRGAGVLASFYRSEPSSRRGEVTPWPAVRLCHPCGAQPPPPGSRTWPPGPCPRQLPSDARHRPGPLSSAFLGSELVWCGRAPVAPSRSGTRDRASPPNSPEDGPCGVPLGCTARCTRPTRQAQRASGPRGRSFGPHDGQRGPGPKPRRGEPVTAYGSREKRLPGPRG